MQSCFYNSSIESPVIQREPSCWNQRRNILFYYKWAIDSSAKPTQWTWTSNASWIQTICSLKARQRSQERMSQFSTWKRITSVCWKISTHNREMTGCLGKHFWSEVREHQVRNNKIHSFLIRMTVNGDGLSWLIRRLWNLLNISFGPLFATITPSALLASRLSTTTILRLYG